jgi:hypothetical protein
MGGIFNGFLGDCFVEGEKTWLGFGDGSKSYTFFRVSE